MAYSSPIANTIKIGNSGTTTTTDAIDTTGADFIVVAIGYDNSQPKPTITDSKGNSWSARTAYLSGGSVVNVCLFYCRPSSVGSGHTFTSTAAGGMYGPVAALAFSGSVASPYDQESGTGNTATSIQPGSITPSEDNCLLITALAYESSDTTSIDSGFTISNQIDFSAGASYGLALAYLIQTSAAAANPTWSRSGAQKNAATMATFKAAAAAGFGGGHLSHAHFSIVQR